MDNRRRYARWNPKLFFQAGKKYTRRYFEVRERETDQSIGKLEDLTLHGFRISSESALEEGKQYSFEIALPEEIDGVSHILVDAECVWCMEDKGPEVYHAGFSILNLSPPYTEIIDMLIPDEAPANRPETERA